MLEMVPVVGAVKPRRRGGGQAGDIPTARTWLPSENVEVTERADGLHEIKRLSDGPSPHLHLLRAKIKDAGNKWENKWRNKCYDDSGHQQPPVPSVSMRH